MVLIHTEASVEAKSVSNVALPPKKSLGIATESFTVLVQVSWTRGKRDESFKRSALFAVVCGIAAG